MTEDEMIGWHHQLNGHEFEQTLGDSEGQEDWHAAGHRVAELDMTEQLNNNLCCSALFFLMVHTTI